MEIREAYMHHALACLQLPHTQALKSGVHRHVRGAGSCPLFTLTKNFAL